MSQVLSVTEATLKGFNLSITVRENGDDPKHLEELAFRTIGAWLYCVSAIEQQKYTIPEAAAGSVESRYAAELTHIQDADTDAPRKEPFEFKQTFGDSRVTCWDTFRGEKRINFHLNSDDDLQSAIDTWCAAQNAVDRALEKFGNVQSKTPPNVIQDSPPQGAAQSQAQFDALPSMNPATPKNTPPVPNTAPRPQGDAMPMYTKKDAIAKLAAGDKFKMKIVQIEKHSKDGNDYYEFFEPYGGKAGQFSAVSVFVDNEVAINNGLIGYLGTLNVSMKIPLTGEWVLNCVMGKPKTKTVKGEERTFTSIYVNSFECQPERHTESTPADEIPWSDGINNQ